MLRPFRKDRRRVPRTLAISCLLAAFLCLLSAGASAQSRTTELERRVQTLEEEVEALKIIIAQMGRSGDQSDGAGFSRGKTATNRSWEGLRVGMPQDSVRALLGKPSRTQTLSSLTYWYYEGGTAYIKPHVVFENENRLVYGWVTP